MNITKQYDGIVWISEKQTVNFHYEAGILEFLNDGLISFENNTTIIGKKRGLIGSYILFHFPLPLDNYGTLHQKSDTAREENNQPITFGNVTQEVDYYIDGYEENSEYTQLRFTFPELDYFLPSGKMCMSSPVDDFAYFIVKPEIVNQFIFEFDNKPITFSLLLRTIGSKGIKSYAQTISELRLEFEKTNDKDFLFKLYYLIHDFFSFICNRQNITIDTAELIGNYTHKSFVKNGEEVIGDKISPLSSSVTVLDKYKAPYENDKKIGKTISHNALSSSFESLFSMFVNNKVSVLSIHSSTTARNLLDLKQCLHITAAFEYYQRTFLPNISSDTTIQFYDDILAMVQEYADKHTGKKKDKARDFIKSFKPDVSLGEKIRKTYNGYSEWVGVKNILIEYFGDDVKELAYIANEWRNELAHEKREYEPDEKVIQAVRLVEHLNYCIVLRIAGYSDEEIKLITAEILTR